MSFRVSSIGWGVLAFIIGAAPAFWLGGPAFFADGVLGERLSAVGIYAVLVFVLATGGGMFAPSHRLAICVGMALPAVGVLLLAEWQQPGTPVLAAVFILAAGLATWTGTWIGSTLTAKVLARRG